MNPYRTIAGGALEIRTPIPHGRLAFGALLVLAAVVYFVDAFRAAGARTNLLLPLVVLGLGLGLVLGVGRHGTTLDREASTVTRWWGVWFLIHRKTTHFDPVAHVSLGREVRGGGKDSVTVHPVRLVPGNLDVCASEDYGWSRRTAERIANHLGASLHDSSSGAIVVRAAGTLDDGLRARSSSQRGQIAALSEPAPSRLAVRREGDAMVCVVPAPGLDAFHAVQVPVAALMAYVVIHFVGASPITYAWCVALPIVVLPGLLDAAFGRATLTFSRRGVALRRWLCLRRERRVSAEALEELVVAPARDAFGRASSVRATLLARSDETTLTLGRNLEVREAEWLCAAIEHELTVH